MLSGNKIQHRKPQESCGLIRPCDVIVDSVSYVPSDVISLNPRFLINMCSVLINMCPVNSNTGHQNSGNVLEMMRISLSTCFTFILREFAFLVALPHNLSKIKFYLCIRVGLKKIDEA